MIAEHQLILAVAKDPTSADANKKLSAYDKQLKSRIADMKNVGGRAAGSITAAQFLKRFVKDETPWIHLDIAGVASVNAETPYAPKGASGWGVLALNRLVADRFETKD